MAYKIINISSGDLLDPRMIRGSFQVVDHVTPRMTALKERSLLSIIDLDDPTQQKSQEVVEARMGITPADAPVQIETPEPDTQESTDVSSENPAPAVADAAHPSDGHDRVDPAIPVEPVAPIVVPVMEPEVVAAAKPPQQQTPQQHQQHVGGNRDQRDNRNNHNRDQRR